MRRKSLFGETAHRSGESVSPIRLRRAGCPRAEAAVNGSQSKGIDSHLRTYSG